MKRWARLMGAIAFVCLGGALAFGQAQTPIVLWGGWCTPATGCSFVIPSLSGVQTYPATSGANSFLLQIPANATSITVTLDADTVSSAYTVNLETAPIPASGSPSFTSCTSGTLSTTGTLVLTCNASSVTGGWAYMEVVLSGGSAAGGLHGAFSAVLPGSFAQKGGGSGLTNPMTTLGDTIYGGASGVATRLAGPTTTGTYALTEAPSGTAVAPTWTNLATYLASPPAIGGTAAAAINGTTITATTGFLAPGTSISSGGYGFSSLSTARIFNNGNNELQLTQDGSNFFYVSTSFLVGGHFGGTSGSLSTPAFSNNSTTGMLFSGTTLELSSGGVLADSFTATATTLTGGATTFGASQTNAAAACETSYGATTVTTSGVTTTTGLNCLPANSVIDAVVYRITTAITTAASFTVGQSGSTSQFCSTQSTLTLGATGTCVPSTYAPQSTAAPVVVTFNANPGAGAIRLAVYYHTWTAPTS